MTQSQAWGLLVISGVIAVMYVRARDVRPFQALSLYLFGFSTACTPVGYPVVWVLHVAFGVFK